MSNPDNPADPWLNEIRAVFFDAIEADPEARDIALGGLQRDVLPLVVEALGADQWNRLWFNRWGKLKGAPLGIVPSRDKVRESLLGWGKAVNLQDEWFLEVALQTVVRWADAIWTLIASRARSRVTMELPPINRLPEHYRWYRDGEVPDQASTVEEVAVVTEIGKRWRPRPGVRLPTTEGIPLVWDPLQLLQDRAGVPQESTHPPRRLLPWTYYPHEEAIDDFLARVKEFLHSKVAGRKTPADKNPGRKNVVPGGQGTHFAWLVRRRVLGCTYSDLRVEYELLGNTVTDDAIRIAVGRLSKDLGLT